MDPFSPLAKVIGVTTVFPDTGLPQVPTQSSNSDNEVKQSMFHTEKATMLSVFYLNLLFLPRGCMLPWWLVVFGVATGKLFYYWALWPRCGRAGQKCPDICLN